MTTILDEIVEYKRKEVADRKGLYPLKLLEQSPFFDTPCVSLRSYLERSDRVGVIAEIKRKSPSKGLINPYISVEQLSIGYMQAGASALSILTDAKFFGGKGEDVTIARKFNYCPILRKDFTVDEYQIVEAKALGADAVLLIAAVLTPEEVKHFAQLARSLGLEALLEVHSLQEIQTHTTQEVSLIGVNNRNLSDFCVDVGRSFELAELIPNDFVKVAESGISQPDTVAELKKVGFKGFLVGEAFMQTSKPEVACRKFIDSVSNR